MKIKNKKSDISIIAPILTLIIFSVCILFVLLFGAKLYKQTIDNDSDNFYTRTLNQYLSTKIHQSDSEGTIFISDFDDTSPKNQGNTFFFVENYDGIEYYTRIYCYNGYLYELFSIADDTFSMEDGIAIMPLNDLYFSNDNGRIDITVTYPTEITNKITITLRSYN